MPQDFNSYGANIGAIIADLITKNKRKAQLDEATKKFEANAFTTLNIPSQDVTRTNPMLPGLEFKASTPPESRQVMDVNNPQFATSMAELLQAGGGDFLNAFMMAQKMRDAQQPNYSQRVVNDQLVTTREQAGLPPQTYNVENYADPQADKKPTSIGSQDWQTELDTNGKPITYQVPGTNDIKLKQWKWQMNPGTGQLEKIYNYGTGGNIPSATSQSQEADAFTLSPETIQMIGENRIPLDKALPGTRGLFGVKIRDKAIREIQKAYPDYQYYTAQNFGSMDKDYQPGGRVGSKAVQLNTAVLHSGRVIEAAQALANGDIPGFNRIANAYRESFGGEKLAPLQRLKGAIDAYSGELGSLFKSGNASATEFDVQNIMTSLRAADSPATIRDVVKEYAQLGADKIAEIDRGYKTLRGRLYNDRGLLGEPQRKLLGGLGIQIDSIYSEGGGVKATHKYNPATGKIEEIK